MNKSNAKLVCVKTQYKARNNPFPHEQAKRYRGSSGEKAVSYPETLIASASSAVLEKSCDPPLLLLLSAWCLSGGDKSWGGLVVIQQLCSEYLKRCQVRIKSIPLPYADLIFCRRRNGCRNLILPTAVIRSACWYSSQFYISEPMQQASRIISYFCGICFSQTGHSDLISSDFVFQRGSKSLVFSGRCTAPVNNRIHY